MELSERLGFSDEEKKWETLVHDLSQIGINLSAEKNIDNLLELILKESMRITQSDAGSIYIKEGEPPQEILKFKYTQCVSKDFPFSEFVLPVNKKSIAGACAYLGEILNFKDMSETIDKLGLEHNKTFDNSIGYSTRNMLVIPMRNYSGDIIGIMQLINKKRSFDKRLIKPEDFDRYIVPYTIKEEEVIGSLSSQAAILIERSILFEEIETQFRSFMEVLVTSLDQRDPVTAGHSKRVADYAVQLAKDLSDTQKGIYAPVVFTEDEVKGIYYAGLLHDVGKIGVAEYVLTKRNKLNNAEFQALEYKFHLYKNELEGRLKHNTIKPVETSILNSLLNDIEILRSINTSGFLDDKKAEKLKSISKYQYTDIDGEVKNILTEKELEMLSVKRGNLTSSERAIIESHPQYTYDVLSGIKWSGDLKNVPNIAAEHHEKLDGTGYPKGLDADKLSLQSRILGVVDIFDALTAKDRPYKPALSLEKTIEILGLEAKANHLDKDLIQIFLNSRSYRVHMGGPENV